MGVWGCFKYTKGVCHLTFCLVLENLVERVSLWQCGGVVSIPRGVCPLTFYVVLENPFERVTLW